MTINEYRKIRPLQWAQRQIGDDVYYTPLNETYTRLFWNDFIRYIFAPKFAKQNSIKTISEFDVTQPALITADLSIRLPAILETIAYLGDNQDESVATTFSIKISSNVALLISLVILILLGISSLFFKKKIKLTRSYVFDSLHH